MLLMYIRYCSRLFDFTVHLVLFKYIKQLKQFIFNVGVTLLIVISISCPHFTNQGICYNCIYLSLAMHLHFWRIDSHFDTRYFLVGQLFQVDLLLYKVFHISTTTQTGIPEVFTIENSTNISMEKKAMHKICIKVQQKKPQQRMEYYFLHIIRVFT